MDNNQVLNALKDYKNFASMAEFARFLGIKSQALSNWYARNTFDIHTLCSKFPEVDANWMLRGEGPMLRSEEEATAATTQAQGTLPVIPIDVIAGWNGNDTPGVSIESCERYLVPEFAAAGAEYLIRVSGSSMYPKYSSGDILACRRVPSIDFFQWGKIYVIDSNQGAMVKRIFPCEEEPNNVVCRSDNEKYPPFTLPKSAIRSLSIVIGVIRLE